MGFDSFFEEVKEEFNYEDKKQEFIDNLDFLKSMSVEEATLYKKWQEFNKSEDFKKRLMEYFGGTGDAKNLMEDIVRLGSNQETHNLKKQYVEKCRKLIYTLPPADSLRAMENALNWL